MGPSVLTGRLGLNQPNQGGKKVQTANGPRLASSFGIMSGFGVCLLFVLLPPWYLSVCWTFCFVLQALCNVQLKVTRGNLVYIILLKSIVTPTKTMTDPLCYGSCVFDFLYVSKTKHVQTHCCWLMINPESPFFYLQTAHTDTCAHSHIHTCVSLSLWGLPLTFLSLVQPNPNSYSLP